MIAMPVDYGSFDHGPVSPVLSIARHSPDAPCLIYEGETHSYAGVADRAGRMAQVLASGGVARGDRVAYLGLNSPTFIAGLLACAWIGGVFVPVSSRLSVEEIRHVLADAGVGTLIAEPAFATTVDAAAGGLAVRKFLVDDDPADPPPPSWPPSWEGLGGALAAAPLAAPPQPCRKDEPALLVYTSGTTGRAKGVPHTHGSLWWCCAGMDGPAGRRSGDVNLVVAPLFHTATLMSFALRTLLRGGCNILRRTFDAERTLADLEAYRVNTLFAVPPMFRALSRLPAFATADLSSLQVAVTAGAPAPADLIRVYAEHGVGLQQAYGMTEILFATCTPPLTAPAKYASVGVPLPPVRIRLFEPGTERPVTEPGQAGEICVKGPSVTAGYWRRPDLGPQTFAGDGWLRSGDIGRFDEDGYLFVVDRVKDMIIMGGENVYSSEVERVVAAVDGIAEVAVVGVPDAIWGEAVLAAVVADPAGPPPTLDRIREVARDRLAGYKIPTKLRILDALPQNATGKVDKNALRRSFGAPAGEAPPPAISPSAPAATAPAAIVPSAIVPVKAPPASTRPAVVAAPSREVRKTQATRAPDAPVPSPVPSPLSGLSPEQRRRFVCDLVCDQAADISGEVDRATLDNASRFTDLGLGSLAAVELNSRLSATLGLSLPATLIFDHPTVGLLVQYILEQETPHRSEESGHRPSMTVNDTDASPVEWSSDDELFAIIDSRLADSGLAVS